MIDFVKLDRSIVRFVDVQSGYTRLIQGLQALANQTNIALIAEGVETESQARVVRQLGIEWIQGFHYSRPEIDRRYDGRTRRDGLSRSVQLMSAIKNASQVQHQDQGSRLALAIERIIRPFIKLIVGRVSCGFLIQQVKRIYIEEARAWIENNDANGRVTKSKLAMLTGLDTRTISSFEEKMQRSMKRQLGDLCAEAAVLDAWNSDAKYRDEDDKPAVLPILAGAPLFRAWFRQRWVEM